MNDPVRAPAPTDMEDRILGCLSGTLIGDAEGLSLEGISRRRCAKLQKTDPDPFLLPRMGSDDAEHAFMTAQALLAAPRGDADAFARELAWRMRWWLVGVPLGLGLATLKGTLRLWVGIPPSKSGVNSAGNGPAMRAPILGVALSSYDHETLRKYVRASTLITHTDPRAETMAFVAAIAARRALVLGPNAFDAEFLRGLLEFIPEDDADSRKGMNAAIGTLERGQDGEALLKALGTPRGVSGFICHTVPASLWAIAEARGDFDKTLKNCFSLGGDTDTVAAIAGGIVGAATKHSEISEHHFRGLCEFPRTAKWRRGLAQRLHLYTTMEETKPMPLAWPLIPIRNVLFTIRVLISLARRALPPY